ncbi:hypothetical protein PFDSM3638_02285 [Pyrococcus furiosus DSM 3638]|uniref:Transglutaminase-like domain-containing protein n=3 Tax=Pyrococcus furiosus TaxID=2261 RepID=Q8U3K6_PYRFU|nr:MULTISPECIES: hypothetical protein [Pyrococcus]AAL80584.1 hypothetical protein PF0460 [Pyrococcus furiosus DSM 3638]AFN03254.1 hypothetical protein PFC_01415 [Pyrococcus furiosus COM1]MDK2869090.1 hypothetical protein [Pyrococcus sp.]QEK78173.1 hypothetical protein PFDSM3638_02285 [Pyrococcus furiosus DSM 3638]
MRHLKILVVMMVLLGLGCLIKSPAQVRFSLDKTVVTPGEYFYIVVEVNNTGKFAIVDVNLNIEGEGFLVVQRPSLTSPIKVGEATKLIWVVKAPPVPGVYPVKIYVDIKDELNRVWKGFIYETTIKVESSSNSEQKVKVEAILPEEIYGGSEFNISLIIKNNNPVPITISKIDIIAGKIKVVNTSFQKDIVVMPASSVKVVYTFQVPHQTFQDTIFFLVEYKSPETGIAKVVKNISIRATLKPWLLNETILRDLYKEVSQWIFYDKIVDGYWEWIYNSDSTINRTYFREKILKTLETSDSDLEAGNAIFNYLITHHIFSERIVRTLNPQEIDKTPSISPIEGNILAVAYFRSANLPARIIALYNNIECTESPITEVYLEGKWFVIDLGHTYFAPRDEYIASRWFPRIYQLITQKNYRIVALKPAPILEHSHEDITEEYVAGIEDVIEEQLQERLDRETYSKVIRIVDSLETKEERIFALFLFSSAEPQEIKTLLSKASLENIAKTIKALYQFYYDIEWEEDFRVYWVKLMQIYS